MNMAWMSRLAARRARGTCRAHRFPGRWAMAMGVKFAAILNHHRIPAVLFLGSMQKKQPQLSLLLSKQTEAQWEVVPKADLAPVRDNAPGSFLQQKLQTESALRGVMSTSLAIVVSWMPFLCMAATLAPSPRPSSPSLCRLCHLCRLCLSLFHLCLLESGQSGKSSASLVHIYPKLFFQMKWVL